MSLLRKRSPIRLRAFWQIATLFGLTVYSAAVLPAQVDQTPPKSQFCIHRGLVCWTWSMPHPSLCDGLARIAAPESRISLSTYRPTVPWPSATTSSIRG